MGVLLSKLWSTENCKPLYDSEVLKELNFSKFASQFNPPVSIKDPGSGLVIRSLQATDYNSGFIQLLGQLTETGDVSQEDFLSRFSDMRKCGKTYFVTVVEDTAKSQVVGAASLVLEQKFIHKCALRGRIEDVVVSDAFRGKQLGKLLVVTLVLLAEHLQVYKLTLDCKDNMVPFYQTFGFKREEGNSNYMQIRFKK